MVSFPLSPHLKKKGPPVFHEKAPYEKLLLFLSPQTHVSKVNPGLSCHWKYTNVVVTFDHFHAGVLTLFNDAYTFMDLFPVNLILQDWC